MSSFTANDLIELHRKFSAPAPALKLVPFKPREQFRFPKTKKRRIRRKWEKRDCNWRLKPVDYTAYQMPDGTTYVDFRVVDKLKAITR